LEVSGADLEGLHLAIKAKMVLPMTPNWIGHDETFPNLVVQLPEKALLPILWFN